MKKLIIELNYITNINPKFSNKKIMLSSFELIIFFFTLNFLFLKNYKNSFYLKKLIFFFKPKKNKIITYLRAPYRYKLAKNQIKFNRFFINVKFIFNFKLLNCTNFNTIFFLKKKIKSYLINSSSNLSNLTFFKFNFYLNFINYFLN